MAVRTHEYNALERIAAGQFSWKEDLVETVNHLFFGGCRSSIPTEQWNYYHDRVLKWQLVRYCFLGYASFVGSGLFTSCLTANYFSEQDRKMIGIASSVGASLMLGLWSSVLKPSLQRYLREVAIYRKRFYLNTPSLLPPQAKREYNSSGHPHSLNAVTHPSATALR